jgi:hypothetical protein
MRLALALLLAGCASGRGLTREELISRHTAALGGARAIEGVERLEIEVRIFEGDAPLTGVWRADRQGRMRIDVSAGGRRVFTEAFDGKHGWQMDEPGSVKPSGGAPTLWHGTQFPGRLLGLHEMERFGHSLDLTGRETIEGIDYYVLKLTLKDGFVTSRYLNPATWLLDRGRDLRAMHPDLDAKQTWLESRWSDWRPVAGVLRPYRELQVDVATGKVLQTSEVLRVEVNPVFAAGLFDAPPGL